MQQSGARISRKPIRCELDVPNGQARDPHPKTNCLVIGIVLSQRETFVRLLKKILIKISGFGRIENVGVDIPTANLALEKLQVGAHLLSGLAIISMQELMSVCLHVCLRIPKQLGQQVGAQGTQFSVSACRVIALLEKAFHLVLNEKRDVWLQGIEVRERLLVMTEVGRVIPNI